MFQMDDDMTMYLTRGDVAYFTVAAEYNGVPYIFRPGDVVRISVTAKKDCNNVALRKDFVVTEDTDKVDMLLTENDTRFGDIINKPVVYWYEIELNPYTNPQTIVGYDEDGPKILRLYPEGADTYEGDVDDDDIPPVDGELSLTSERPVQNQAVTRALVQFKDTMDSFMDRVNAGEFDGEQGPQGERGVGIIGATITEE